MNFRDRLNLFFVHSFWLGATLALACWAIAGSTQAEEGRIVQLDPDGDAEIPQADDAESGQDAEEPVAPTYWLGLAGGPVVDPTLRTHLQLAADTGVLINSVVPESPAEAAGLREHDIILRVGDTMVHDMTILQKAVAESQGAPLSLRIIRLAKEMDLEVTPQLRPANVQLPNADGAEDEDNPLGAFGPGFFGEGQEGFGDFNRLFQQLQNGRPGMRMVGPGIFMGGLDLAQMPNGVSVQIQRQNNEPPQITVRRGEESWTVQGDDPESLKAIPEDLRPFVAQLARQNGNGVGRRMFGGLREEPGARGLGMDDLGKLLPEVLGGENGERLAPRAERAQQRILERMEQLEQQLEQMQRKFESMNPEEHEAEE